jgi:hypothetical protein
MLLFCQSLLPMALSSLINNILHLINHLTLKSELFRLIGALRQQK